MDRSCVFGLCCLFVICTANADTERITDFQYDDAGNIVRIINNEQFNPPDVVDIAPGFINVGRTVSMTANGTDLFAAQVTTSTSGLTISNVKADKSLITFNVSAASHTSLGTALLTFHTGLGSDSHPITIAEALPGLISIPSPIAVPANNQTQTIQLVFTDPRPSTETYSVSVSDPFIATANQATLTVATGATTAQLELSGFQLGVTTLNIVLAEKFYFFSFPVFVSENFVSDGDLSSPAVGVFMQSDEQNLADTVLSRRVGLFFDPPEGSTGNPLLSKSIGVFLQSDTAHFGEPIISPDVGVFFDSGDESSGNPLLSSAVGVFFESLSGGGLGNPLLGQPVGVHTGALVTTVEPEQLITGQQNTVQITGLDLNDITEISVIPAGNVTIDSFSALTDGTALTLSLTVGASASPGDYQLLLTTVAGEATKADGFRTVLTIP